jgi:exopolyphosphatase / guanosine-5'-triphosphate,3'-diphosphate pyrophosphatase
VTTVAAIDCGTNSTRLLIADGTGTTLLRLMRITRLGEGVDATHVLSEGAIARTLEVLREYRVHMDAHQVSRTRVVATSAARDASNGAAFLQAASNVVGAAAELLPGEEEGRLSYAGATAGLDDITGDTVVVDIGGGSTELVLERQGVIGAVSMELGCVRLSERYLRNSPAGADELGAADAAIGAELDRAMEVIPGLSSLGSGSRLIGLAGTVSTLAALEMGLVDYDRARVHHFTLTRAHVDHWCATLAAEPTEARARRAGMIEGREDVIVGGALILRDVMVRLGLAECLVSESDILDGLVAWLLREAS